MTWTGMRMILGLILATALVWETKAQKPYHEKYRPQIHFSPKAHWINDPNGMVFYKGVYHLFFQYYPDSTVWGPMHWGHATSADLIHWQEQPIALYPDSLGYIFSGNAVVDYYNTSGFGKNGQPPLVAIFTHSLPGNGKDRKSDLQTQSIAYSNDEGKTWTKYQGNPVLKNPGISDFRDPKVSWFEPAKSWIMTLATKDRISFFSSTDLKNWKKESEFGKTQGAHAGVWECPDLFSLEDNGKTVWVLVVNINPGGPNSGSATQYFLGDFDGHRFTATGNKTRWLDYGPDEYAGVTWSNTGKRRIFLGWMSNWIYANQVPTTGWRNAMTLPRELSIGHVGDETYLTAVPAPELTAIQSYTTLFTHQTVNSGLEISSKIPKLSNQFKLDLIAKEIKSFEIELSNENGQKLLVGFDQKKNQYYINRTRSGDTSFAKGFAAIHQVPRFSNKNGIILSLIIDQSSVELFADEGLSVMTEIFFPDPALTKITIHADSNMVFDKIQYAVLKSIWQ